VWTWIGPADLSSAQAGDEDRSGLVEQIARSAGMRVALLFSDEQDGVKISCRSSAAAPSVDAAALMGRYGGGGHVRAAGALVRGDPDDVRRRVLADARAALAAARAPA
ncbi:MAG TPA: DHHA1 domain-containing protein, partial [Candidatus Limnocylindria bacterium]